MPYVKKEELKVGDTYYLLDSLEDGPIKVEFVRVHHDLEHKITKCEFISKEGEGETFQQITLDSFGVLDVYKNIHDAKVDWLENLRDEICTLRSDANEIEELAENLEFELKREGEE